MYLLSTILLDYMNSVAKDKGLPLLDALIDSASALSRSALPAFLCEVLASVQGAVMDSQALGNAHLHDSALILNLPKIIHELVMRSLEVTAPGVLCRMAELVTTLLRQVSRCASS